MNFTNTDRLKQEVYYQEHEQVYKHIHVLLKWQVLCQIYKLSDEVNDQITPIRNTIEQEIK
jgi:hypothetical protein